MPCVHAVLLFCHFITAMDTGNKKDFFGYIIKKEKLQSVDETINCEAFTLKATNPFPESNKQISRNLFYLMISNETEDLNEFIFRVTQQINRNNHKKIEASPCQLTIYNKFYKAIRLYNHQADELEEIESLYKMYGISFLKKQQVLPFISLIKVHKFFELVEVSENIYQHHHDANFTYLQLPYKLNWDDFEFIVNKAKNENNYSNCDFALAVFYSKEGLNDYIRIYSDYCQLEKQQEFQHFILNSIKTLTLK